MASELLSMYGVEKNENKSQFVCLPYTNHKR